MSDQYIFNLGHIRSAGCAHLCPMFKLAVHILSWQQLYVDRV